MGMKKNPIPDYSDQDFLSFLYSERERENSLSLYHGWSNWALIGAIITALSVAYATIKGVGQINGMRIMYYSTGVVSFFLAYHSCFNFINRDRGHDNTRVRLLQEMTPWADSVLAIITASTAIVLIFTYDSISDVFWSWIIVLVVQLFVVTVALINKEQLVPYYFDRPYSPSLRWNITYDGIAGGLFAWVWISSFKKASWCITNLEFEIGICLGAAIVLFYYLIRVNVENRTVEQFDAIIDRYLYAGESKEETFNRILCNRMGYGVWEVCQKDLAKVQDLVDDCEKKRQELEDLKKTIQSGNYDICQIKKENRRLGELLKFLEDSLKQSDKLAKRLNEMVKIAPILDYVEVIDTIFGANQELCSKVKAVQKEVGEVLSLLQKEYEKYYCQKAHAICWDLDCDQRNEPADKKYIRQLRRRHLLTKATKKVNSRIKKS